MFQLHKSYVPHHHHHPHSRSAGKRPRPGNEKCLLRSQKKAKRSTWRMRLVGQCILGNWQVRSHVFFPSSHTISNYKYIFRAADLYPIEGGLILLSGFRLPGFGCKICIYMGEYSSSCGVRWQMNKWTDCRVFWYLILVGKCGV